MKFTIDRLILKEHLAICNSISEKDHQFTMYIGTLFSVKENTLSLFCMSEKLRYNVLNIPITGDTKKIIRFGLITDKIHKIVMYSDCETITFEMVNNQIKVGAVGEYLLNTLAEEEFFDFEIDSDSIEFKQILPELFKANFLMLKKHTSNNMSNPADCGIFVDKAMVAAHSDNYGVVAPLGLFSPKVYLDTEVSVDLRICDALVHCKTEEAYIGTNGNCFTVKWYSYYESMVCTISVLEGRVLIGKFKNKFIELMNSLFMSKDAIKLIVKREDWSPLYNRNRPLLESGLIRLHHFTIEAIKISSHNELARDSSQEILPVISENLSPFDIIINAFDFSSVFNGDEVIIYIDPDDRGEYNIVSLLNKKNGSVINTAFLKIYEK